MYFNKYPYISNFDFVDHLQQDAETNVHLWDAPSFESSTGKTSKTTISIEVEHKRDDIYVITARGPLWRENDAQTGLSLPMDAEPQSCFTTLTMNSSGETSLKTLDGEVLLESVLAQFFGKSGEAHLFQFKQPDGAKYYGMGEKNFGRIELSGIKTKFWNTDVWADFAGPVFTEGVPDPVYVSVPYLIVKSGQHWVGLLLDNPHATFMSTDNSINIAGQLDADEQTPESSILLGSEKGQPRLILLAATSLASLTRKLQGIVGNTPLPPAWSLGYHQCRWGYESLDCLNYIGSGMTRNEVPCDAVWLDIDYMKGYRVFTLNEEHFPNGKDDIEAFQAKGRRVIPILDPGVKVESGYGIYESGCSADIFCKNPQGKSFVGLVWPGETVFPDYSKPECRDWWSDHVKTFAEFGFTGAWLDMNDPATGDSLNELMLFNDGKKSHSSFHNQYGMAMSKASRKGFEKANPNERPFLLSRSGCTGSSKYAAIWTGDNVSNYHHLKLSIPTTLNLALSGIPFNGPDVAGFGGDTTAQLMIDWIKAGFLFPFLRNHSNRNCKPQEPWAFDHETLLIYRHYVQLRYKLRPYLYNLFIDQAERGEAILRPLFYDFEHEEASDLSEISDQFMVGPSLLQAPFVEEASASRTTILPSTNWYDITQQQFIDGGKSICTNKSDWTTPLYIRTGAIIPLLRNEGGDHSFCSSKVNFHLFSKRGLNQSETYAYRFDDGLTLDYQKGKQSQLNIETTVIGDEIHITTDLIKDGYGEIDAQFFLLEPFSKIMVNGKEIQAKPETFTWHQKPTHVWRCQL